MSKYLEDENRLERLRSGNDREWKTIYDDLRSPFRLFLMKKVNLDSEEAAEVFHESMIIFHRNVLNRKLVAPLQSSLKTYLFGIGKNVLRKKGRQGDWETDIPDLGIAAEVESLHERAAKVALLKRLLSKIGDSCRQLLELVYLKGYVMEAAAKELNISSEGTARKRKFDCLKKMRAMLEET